MSEATRKNASGILLINLFFDNKAILLTWHTDLYLHKSRKGMLQ